MEGNLVRSVEAIGVGLTLGMGIAFVAPKLIKSKIYTEIDSAIDKVGLPAEITKAIKREFHKQIEQKIKKQGLIKTVLSLIKIADELKEYSIKEKKKEEKQKGGLLGFFGGLINKAAAPLEKLNFVNKVLTNEGFDISSIIAEGMKGAWAGLMR